MWKWLSDILCPQASAHASTQAGAPADFGSRFWLNINGGDLAQGDLLHDCLVPIYPSDLATVSAGEGDVDVGEADLIIVTQSCDLENSKVDFVALCPIFSLAEFSDRNPLFKRKGERNEIRNGRREGLHMLGSPTDPDDNLQSLIVDFRQIYSLPVDYLKEHANRAGMRWRLRSPYLEHFSQAFARFFMRVGLPASIPKF